MEIKKTSKKYSSTSSITTRGGKKSGTARKVDFKESIARAERTAQQKVLQEMVDDILAQGRKLAQRADLKELKEYRKLVSLFLDQLVDRTHRFTKQSFLDRIGRHKVYAIIKKINAEMELLTGELMKSEKNNMVILERIDVIKGLILDIEL